jgi:hypothetical protein
VSYHETAAALLALALVISTHAHGKQGPLATLAPRIESQTALTALPEALAQGASGPINRIAFELTNFNSSDPESRIQCIYPGALQLSCRATRGTELMAAERERVIVDLPDIDRGSRVIVRFINPHGQADREIRIVNRPQVIHEIESVLLPGGGRVINDTTGQPSPSLQTSVTRARTAPTLALQPNRSRECGSIYPRWVNANATDAVFTSRFGVLTGSVVTAQPPTPGPVTPDSAPEWLITFPLGASRVQFIAHYEIEYRVVHCQSPSSRTV